MAEIPKLLRVSDVLERLRGTIGRSKLLEHLKNYPEHNGAPTHRRIVGRIVFHPDDIIRLIDSLECHSKSSHAPAEKRSTYAVPSADKAYLSALALLTPTKQKRLEPNARQNSGLNPSTASGQR